MDVPSSRRWAGVTVALAWVLADAPLAVLTVRSNLSIDAGSWAPAAVAAVVGSVLVAVLVRGRFRTLALNLAMLGGSSAIVSNTPMLPGTRVGILSVLLWCLLPTAWAWALGVALPQRLRPRAGLARGAVVPLSVAAVVLPLVPDVRVGMVPAVFGILLLVVRVVPRRADVGPRAAGPLRRMAGGLHRLGARIGRPFGRVLGTVAMLPAAVVVLFEWGLHRALRYDSLAPPVTGDSRWVVRAGTDPDTRRRFGGAAERDPRPRRAAHRGAVTAAHLGLAGLAVALIGPDVSLGGIFASPTTTNPPLRGWTRQTCIDTYDRSSSPVMADVDYWPAVNCTNQEFVSHPKFDASTVFSYEDIRSRYLNERDGVRRTWAPPPCTCRRLKVWWLGGSAAWGAFQRDDHSLPSSLARQAWRDGIALDVDNLALPAWTVGQEVRRVAELSTRKEPPDLVVYFHGGNDVSYQLARNGRGAGDDPSPLSAAEVEIGEFLVSGPFGQPSSTTSGPPRRPVSYRRVAEVVMQRYGRDVELARRVAAAMGAESAFFWQPVGELAPKRVGPGFPKDDLARYAAMQPTIERELPEGVVDLTHVLDDADRQVFMDTWHTTEYGADIVARRILDELRPRLATLAETGGS